MAETTMPAALVKFLSELKNPERTATARVPTKSGGGYSYTYAELPDILNEARQTAAAHGLAIIQDVRSENGSVGVRTILVHTSGERMESDWLYLPAGDTAQTAGSGITYARRYSLTAFLGIAGEDDDDGAAAGKRAPAKTSPTRDKPVKALDTEAGSATQKQLGYIHKLAEELELAENDITAIKHAYGVMSSKELSMAGASDFIELLKSAQENGLGCIDVFLDAHSEMDGDYALPEE